jgi:hypothetical protein
MKWFNFRNLALAGLAALGMAQATAATVSVSGLLYGTNNWVASNEYVLSGFTYIPANSVLNIEAGTVIKGVPGTGTGAAAANDFGVLFVLQGGKLNANGTPTRPIIMTAEADDVTDPADLPFPSRGLWGGLVMFGKARINNPASTTNNVSFDIYEGLPDTAVTNTTVGPFLGQVDYLHRFGGSDDTDSSGSLRYVSIRHGGKKLTTDKEINGLSLGGVGNGTVIDFVEAYCIADDGFEFFGGSVNTKHLVSAFNDDDAFDTDQGYNGKNQFWFAIQDNTRDQGSEQNGQPQPNDLQVVGAQPLSKYTIYNATLIGSGGAGSGNDAHNIRRNNFCRWYNSVFTQFQGRRVRVDADSNPEFANNLFFGFAQAGTSGDVYGTHPGVPAALNPQADPLLRAVSRTQAGLLDPRPTAGSPVFTGVRAFPADGFYDYAPYKGAFDSQDVWIDGWTALSQEGVSRTKDNVVNVPAGYLYGTHNWVSSNTYLLQGFVYVMSNAVLNIEPGTVIKGVPGTGTGAAAANDFGCLFVTRGGKLNALGTPNNPIIMTAENDDVSDPTDLPFPSRGLWGGLVLFGNARINNPASTTNSLTYDIYEGLPDTAIDNGAGQIDYLHRFGGTDDNDSSGVIRYVSIRHGGKKLTTDKEINGASLGGVGRGTTFEYIEAYAIADDGFEFFGGSVNTRYLVSAFNDDDCFDTDQGFNGKNQFWFAIQSPDARDSGSEQNGQPQPNDLQVVGALPLSDYTVYNATLIGAGTTGSGNAAHNVRRNNFCRWYNGVFTEFQGRRVLIDADSTPDFKNNLFFGFAGAGASGDVYGTHPSVPAALNPVLDPLLNSISRTANGLLDPTVKPASPVFADYRATPSDGFYVPVAHKGAFGTVNWAQDWTALSAEGFLKATTSPTSRPQSEAVVTTASATADGSSVLLVYGSRAGVLYKVQSTTDGLTWVDETDWAPGTGTTVGAVYSVGGVRKVFRVITNE